jgi:hypothetical protein
VSICASVAVGVGVGLLLLYGCAVQFYLKGKGREDLESAIKAFLIMAANGGFLEIVRRGRSVILVFYRADGQLNWADLRLRIPFRTWSLPLVTELQQVFSCAGFEFSAIDGSIEWIAEVRIPVDDIWAVGSADRGAEAANLALDALGFGKDERFNFKLQGKKSWRIMNRPR